MRWCMETLPVGNKTAPADPLFFADLPVRDA